MTKHVLVTGSSGFIGSSLVSLLRSTGHTITYADRTHGVDLTNYDMVQLLPNVDIVIHLAAVNNPKQFDQSPLDVIRTNVLSTQYLLDRYAGHIERFVLASSSQCYASTSNRLHPTDEYVPLTINDVTVPRNSYAGSKIINEQQVTAAYTQFKQDYTIIRYHNLYGPNQRNQFIPDFISRAKQGNFEINGGNATRTYMYIDDAVRATVEIINNPLCINQIINVGGSEEVSINQVARVILEQLGIHNYQYVDTTASNRLIGDVAKMTSLLNFVPEYSLEDGIRKILTECVDISANNNV